MPKEQYIYKVVVFIPSERAVNQLGYIIPNDTVATVKRQIESESDYIVIRPSEFDGMPFRISVANTMGVTLVKELVKTKSGIEVAGSNILGIDGKRLN